ncbi:MAG: hypothetical protein ACKOA2_00125 [Ilumatobacteraceae bacterium]
MVRMPALLGVPGATAGLLGLTLGVAYSCVPETSQLVWVGLAVAVLGALELGAHRCMPWWGAVAAAVAWGAMSGGRYRDGALVGAVFAWWPWVLMAIASALAPPGRAVRVGVLAAGVGTAAALVVARTGGLGVSAGGAIVAACVAVVVSVPVLAVVLRVDLLVRR